MKPSKNTFALLLLLSFLFIFKAAPILGCSHCHKKKPKSPKGPISGPPTLPNPPTVPGDKPGLSPPGETCPIDALKLGACVDLLGGLVHIGLGNPVVNECCPVLEGLAEVEAAICLCTTLKLNLLNLNIFVPIALQLLLTCGKNPPPGFTCTLNWHVSINKTFERRTTCTNNLKSSFKLEINTYAWKKMCYQWNQSKTIALLKIVADEIEIKREPDLDKLNWNYIGMIYRSEVGEFFEEIPKTVFKNQLLICRQNWFHWERYLALVERTSGPLDDAWWSRLRERHFDYYRFRYKPITTEEYDLYKRIFNPVMD